MTETQLAEIKANEYSFRVYSSRLKLTKEGKEYTGKCPFHADGTPSFHISKYNGAWVWNCFGCGAKGNVFTFVEKFHKIPFSQAVRKVETELGTVAKDSVDRVFKPAIPEIPASVIPLTAWKKYEEALEKSEEGKEFLKSRGIDYATAVSLHFGYRSDLAGKGKTADSTDAGGYIAIPTILRDQVVSIEYRSCSSKKFLRQPGMATSVWGMDSIDPLEAIWVTEGKLDAAALIQSGFQAVSLPTAKYVVTPEEKDALLEADCVILAGDNDSPGNEAMDTLRDSLTGIVSLAKQPPRVFKVKWPCKDANELYLKDPKKFKETVSQLMLVAKSEPVKNFYSLPESMEAGSRTTLTDHPHRWHATWPSIDSMVRILPGGILGITGTNTGVGKTNFITQNEIYEAMKYGEVIIDYSGELTPEEKSNMVAAHILGKDRTKLCYLDYKIAAKKLGGIKYYIGYSPDIDRIGPVLDLIEAAIVRLGATRVILDHLHFFCLNESNTNEVQGNAMQRMKNMANKYNVIFIVLAQPRKALQNLRGKPIHITDIKGNEAVVSTANAFLTIHRESATVSEGEPPPKDPYKSETMIQLLKGRSLGGGPSFAKLLCIGEIATFIEPTHTEESKPSVM